MKPLRDREFLVIERRPSWLRVAVVRVGTAAPVILAVSEGLSADYPVSLSACIESLTTKRKNLPKRAVLVSTELLPAFLPLQIAPGMASAQVNEMLRWETEDAFESLHRTPSLDKALLQADFFGTQERGLLRDVLATPGTESRQGAINAGILDLTELELLEHHLGHEVDPGEAVEFAWAPARPGFFDSAHTLVAGAALSVKAQTSAVLQRHGIELAAMVPWWLSGLGLLRQKQIERGSFVLLHRSLLSLTAAYFVKGVLRDMRAYHGEGVGLPAALIKDLSAENPTQLGLVGAGWSQDEILDELALAGVRGQITPWKPEAPVDRDLWAIAGAATLCSALGQGDYPSPILDATPPPLPWSRRPAAWWAAALLLLAPFLLWWIGGTWMELQTLRKSLAPKKVRMNGLALQLRMRESDSEERAEAVKRLSEIEAEIKAWGGSNVGTGGTKYTGVEFPLAVMAAAAKNLSADVHLEELNLNFRGQLTVKGEGASNEAIHQALGAFYYQLASWKVTPEPLTVRASETDAILPYRFSLDGRRDSPMISNSR